MNSFLAWRPRVYRNLRSLRVFVFKVWDRILKTREQALARLGLPLAWSTPRLAAEETTWRPASDPIRLRKALTTCLSEETKQALPSEILLPRSCTIS